MLISVLFGQRKESYEGEYAPEVLLAWDEFAIDENYEGYQDDLKRAQEEHKTCMAAMRVINIEVDGERIHKLLVREPIISGEISE